MKKVIKRLRISENTENFYRLYFGAISFQKFIDLCIENQKLRTHKKRMTKPF